MMSESLFTGIAKPTTSLMTVAVRCREGLIDPCGTLDFRPFFGKIALLAEHLGDVAGHRGDDIGQLFVGRTA